MKVNIFMPKLEGNHLFDRVTQGKTEQTHSFFKDILVTSLEENELAADAEPVNLIDAFLGAKTHIEQLLHEQLPNEAEESKAEVFQDIEHLLIQLNELTESNMLQEEYIDEEVISELLLANKLDEHIAVLLEKVMESQNIQLKDKLPVTENDELGKSIVYLHQLQSLHMGDFPKQLTDKFPITDHHVQQMERAAALIFQSAKAKQEDTSHSRHGQQPANQLALKFSSEQSDIEIQTRPVQETLHDMKPVVTRGEPYIIRLSENNGQGLQMREFAKEFENILQRSHFSQLPHTKKLTIRLYPEHLGSLRIELVQREGMMLARILASSNMAKELLDNHIHQLRHAFTQQNILMDRIEITHNHEFLKYSQNEGQQNQNGSQREKQEDHRQMDEQNEADFSQVLNDFLFESEA